MYNMFKWCTRKKIVISSKVLKSLCIMKNTTGAPSFCKVSLRWFMKRFMKLVPPSLQGCLTIHEYSIMPSKLRSLEATTQEDPKPKKKRAVIAVQLIHHLHAFVLLCESIHKGRWLIILFRNAGKKFEDFLKMQNIYTVVHGGVWTIKIDFMLIYLNTVGSGSAAARATGAIHNWCCYEKVL